MKPIYHKGELYVAEEARHATIIAQFAHEPHLMTFVKVNGC